MYLRSIELQGFKSFATKITFEFHNGVTAIVGPNGSGKSNVADAVRWVLGEQKARQLRSSSMQDVIFSGTETRKPLGFAYVAITFDNSDHALALDYDEVTVSRRLYRSGESEYMLNGSNVRLKDINEIFYDTGIGKEGYSIIGQGQIDRILSDRPEERRELFDEAAGIVKFKRRKAATQKRLDDEEQNITRVNDILGELEKQVAPLKEQAETAKEYLRLKEELKRYETALFLHDAESYERDLAANEEHMSLVTGDMQETAETAGRLKEEFEAASEGIRELDDAISASQSAANEALMNAGSLEGRINVLKEQIRTEEVNSEHILNRIDAIDRELAERELSKSQYEEEKNGLRESVDAMNEKLAAATRKSDDAAANAGSLEKMIEDAKSSLIDALNRKASLSVERQRFETMSEQIEVRRAEIAQRLLKIRTDEEAWKEEKENRNSDLKEITDQIAVLSESAKTLGSSISNLSESVSSLSDELAQKNRDYNTVSARYESLRNLTERYDGYGTSIKRVMERREDIPGICGVVADLIEVPKEYETAIETALGGTVQNIVTDTEETAKTLIGYLKKNKYGRATFLPLSGLSARGGLPDEDVLTERGVIGVASSLVRYKKEYQILVDYLLGRVIVVDNIDHAINIAKKYHHTLRMVTPDGELLNPGGSISGGAYKNSSSLLGRRRELEELEASVKECESAAKKIQDELIKKNGLLDEKRTELDTVREELQQKYIEENTAKLELSRLDERFSESAESGDDLNLENAELEKQAAQIKADIESLDANVGIIEKDSDEKNVFIEENTKILETARNERDAAAEELSAVRLEAAKIKQQDDFISQNLTRIAGETSRLIEEKTSLESGNGNSSEAVNRHLVEIESLKEKIKGANELADRYKAQTDELNAQRAEKLDRQNEFIARRDELSERTTGLDRELVRLQNQKEKLEEKRDQDVEYMWSEYGLTLSDAREMKSEEDIPLATLKKQISGRKGQIKDLGNVNVNAIEDYKDVSGRYEFMKEQSDDLAAARENLLKIIDELDDGMKKQFSEKFADISEEFDKVFKELFGGGTGKLELVDDTDLLESGIRIISQPPGKKLQNMMQLSGGEKSLTAIALLFAIQNLKPSPFCLLDEIEAALDDTNVERFNRYLKKLSNHTQFIVITHRRGTMEAADRLYGITMQEKGVSTLVSVDLVENDLT